MSRPSHRLWGGGYRSKISPTMEAFTTSISWDSRLALEDLAGSMAHAKMLGKRRIIPAAQARRLVKGLEAVRKDWISGRLAVNTAPKAEDIHSLLHTALEKKIGAAAQYLHTARSRNDQVITDTRLFSIRAARQMAGNVRGLQRAIVQTASMHHGLIVPGYTHLQHAQPVLWAHWLLAYCEALERDRQRLFAAADRWDELPLGSGALTGTSLPIDRRMVARQLGFSRVAANSIDAVSDRDGLLELLSALAILGIHLSRISEDILLWVSSEVGFFKLDERLTTGSSMMPQKQNPDFLELIRAGAGKLLGTLQGLLAVCKGLPSGYNRDLQMDKEHLFAAVEMAPRMLEALAEGFQGLQSQPQRIAEALQDESLYATDCAEYLVAKGVPFAQAHRAVGELMGYCRRRCAEARGGVSSTFLAAPAAGPGKSRASARGSSNAGRQRQPSQLPLKTFQRFSPSFGRDVYRLFDPKVSVARKRSAGSTHPVLVARQIRRWQTDLNRRDPSARG